MAYVPVLRAQQAELLALRHVDRALASSMRVVLELPLSASLDDQGARLLDQLRACFSFRSIALDCTMIYADGLRATNLLTDLASDLALDTGYPISVRPVLRLDSPSRLVAEARRLGEERTPDLVLRVSCRAAASPARTPDLLRLVASAGASVEQTELVLDAEELPSAAAVHLVLPDVLTSLEWAASAPWGAVTLVAGSFPERTADLPEGQATPVRRREADLWALAGQPHGLVVDVGDFGVVRRLRPEPRRRGRPKPNIRYTHGAAWEVWRWNRGPAGQGSGDTITELCAALVRSETWCEYGPDFSWGDREIARAAQAPAGHGSAPRWLAYSTSHHLAEVARQIGATAA